MDGCLSRARRALGKACPPWPYEVTRAGIRSYARSLGWRDPGYYSLELARQMGYSDLPVPFGYFGESVYLPGLCDEIYGGPGAQIDLEHGLPHTADLGTTQEQLRVPCAGELLHCITTVTAVEAYRSDSIGEGLVVDRELVFRDEAGNVVARQLRRSLYYECARPNAQRRPSPPPLASGASETSERRPRQAPADGRQRWRLSCATDTAMMVRYAGATADYNPLHFDASSPAALAAGAPVVAGRCRFGLVARMLHESLGQRAELRQLECSYVSPLRVGDTQVLQLELRKRSQADGHGWLRVRLRGQDSAGNLNLRGYATLSERRTA